MILSSATVARADASSTVGTAFTAHPPMAYTVQFTGNVRENLGATVHLSSMGNDGKPFGYASSIVDAIPLRHHRLRLSAELGTEHATDGAAIWLRADVGGKPRAFMSSQPQPVNDRTGPGHRQVEIDVPSDAEQIVLAVLLVKQGRATASHLTFVDLGEEKPSPLASKTLDAAIDIVRKNAYHSRDVDWASVESQVRARAGDGHHLSDAHAAIAILLAALNDRHSQQIDATRMTAAPHTGRPSTPATIERRGDDLGYVVMPGYEGTDPKLAEAFASPLSRAIVELSPPCGWIVDLRQDTGGSMYPMLAALRPLLGASSVGSFEHADGRIIPWRVPGSTTADQSTKPVAVLTGRRTASSGEIVAIAFRGRLNTRSFGMGSAGLSTSNSTFRLPDGSAIALTTGIDRDRDGHAYGGVVEPDESVDDSEAEVTAAAWLRTKCDGSRRHVASP